MNKFKHVTPTNIAPLGKRQSNMVSFIKKEEHHKLQNENHKQVMAATNIHGTQTNELQQNQTIQQSHQQSHNITHITNSQQHAQQNHNDNVLHQTQLHQSQNQNHSQAQQSSNISLQLHHQQMTWSCELCGRMFPTREEWTIHAKSHLEVSACSVLMKLF